MNENYNNNGDNSLPKATSKDVFILTIFIGLFLLICAFGVYGFISNLKSNENDTNVDYFEVVLPEKNDKFTFLNYLKDNITDDIEVIRYYYLDEEELLSPNSDNIDTLNTYYILREETYVNGVMVGKIAVLEVLKERIQEVKEDYLLNHKILSFKDTDTSDNYVLVKKSNNEYLIENGRYPFVESDDMIFDDVTKNIMYLVNKNGNVLKEFYFDDCWLTGIVLPKEKVEDRYFIETDTNVFDYSLNDFVEGHGPVIYPDGRYFDVHNDYFYWLDRLNNNIEYRFEVKNGKLIEKQTRTYDLYNYGFMEVGCV